MRELARQLPDMLVAQRAEAGTYLSFRFGESFILLPPRERWVAHAGVRAPQGARGGAQPPADRDGRLLHLLGWHPSGNCRLLYHYWDDDTPVAEVARDLMRAITGVYLRTEDGTVQVRTIRMRHPG